jgi:hypothetical protein
MNGLIYKISMSFMRLKVCVGMSYHGILNLFKDFGTFADNLVGIHNVLVKCLYIVNRKWIHKDVEVPPQVDIQMIQIM